MATEINVEKINVAALMATEDAQQAKAKFEALVHADPKANALLAAAESVEDVYQVIKRFIDVTLDQVKAAFHKTMDYFKGSKVELDDDTLDNVVGGWSLSSWWNKYKDAVTMVTGVVLIASMGVALGAVTFGVGGAIIGGIAGTVAGSFIISKGMGGEA